MSNSLSPRSTVTLNPYGLILEVSKKKLNSLTFEAFLKYLGASILIRDNVNLNEQWPVDQWRGILRSFHSVSSMKENIQNVTVILLSGPKKSSQEVLCKNGHVAARVERVGVDEGRRGRCTGDQQGARLKPRGGKLTLYADARVTSPESLLGTFKHAHGHGITA